MYSELLRILPMGLHKTFYFPPPPFPLCLPPTRLPSVFPPGEGEGGEGKSFVWAPGRWAGKFRVLDSQVYSRQGRGRGV